MEQRFSNSDALAAEQAAALEAGLRFRQMADTIEEVFWMIDLDKQGMSYISPAYETIWGRTCQSLYDAPMSFFEAIHPEDRERVKSSSPKRASGTFDETYRIIKPDGTIRWIRDRAFRVYEANGMVSRVVGVAQDITVYKSTEQRLDRLSVKLINLGLDPGENIKSVTALAVEIMEADSGAYCRFEDGQPKLVAVAGHPSYSSRQLQPGFCAGGIAWGSDEAVVLVGEEARAQGGKVFVAQPVRSGLVCVGCLTLNYKDDHVLSEEDRRFIHIIAAAIGVEEDRRTKQLALQASEEQLRQAQKLEAIGRLAGGVAHDFNNLLTAIMGYCELLRIDLPEDSPSQEDVELIRQTGTRASELTRHLLAFSRRQKLNPRIIDLNEVVDEIGDMLSRLIGDDIELEVLSGKYSGRVNADKGQIHQVLVNLVVNARDAMPKGGKLLIETSEATLGEDYARSHLNVRPGRYVVLSVSDSGCGMDPLTVTQIFEPFFTTKPKDKGTGLGLSTVYGIVRQSGGHITVYSEPGIGSCFKVYLPSVAGGVPEGKEIVSPPSGSLRGTEKVLVVDDDQAVRLLVTRVLEMNGYKVMAASNPKEAFRLAAGKEDQLQLIVSDVVMPGMSGPDMVKQLCAGRTGLRAIFMSGYVERAMVSTGFLESDAQFLQKPFTPTDLALLVRQVLDVSR